MNTDNLLGGQIAMDRRNVLGPNLFYRGADSKLYILDWQNADNPVSCPFPPTDTSQNPIAALRSDSVDNKYENMQGSDTADNASLAVFPNPSKSSFTFIVKGITEQADMDITIQDLSGRPVGVLNRSVEPGKNEKLVWDASAVSGGIYYYQAKMTNGQFLSGKLVKLQQ